MCARIGQSVPAATSVQTNTQKPCHNRRRPVPIAGMGPGLRREDKEGGPIPEPIKVMRVFRFFENLLEPTALPPEGAPPAGLGAFYWYYARQARRLVAALFVAGFIVAILDTTINPPTKRAPKIGRTHV